jgi:hypothetical protein
MVGEDKARRLLTELLGSIADLKRYREQVTRQSCARAAMRSLERERRRVRRVDRSRLDGATATGRPRQEVDRERRLSDDSGTLPRVFDDAV